ncbi:AGAP003495-PA-like protein [Anopheles sinensis]|uniref:AGAP003495-PA-like protein n=1 Tax=Anopheles sinensis TaxID=74873 RepID=A0A084VDV9_ANOSI|nr:AGAP003495-PA-like protein [Anopheles sinensis]
MHWRYCELLAGAVANLATVSLGCAIAWPSPVLLKLTDVDLEDNPFGVVVTERDKAWIDGALAIGGLCGPLVARWISLRKGRRIALLLSAVPYIVAWLLLMIVGSVSLLIVARAVTGFANGYVLLAVTLYIGEIASDRYRGALGCFIQIGTTLGILYVYCLGPFVSYLALQALCCAIPILFGILFLYMPETPHFLVERGLYQRAAETLMFLRGAHNLDDVQPELDELKQYIIQHVPGATTRGFAHLWQLVTSRANRRALIITIGLVVFQQATGIDSIIANSEPLFAKANSALDPVHSTIVLGAIQFISSCATPFFIDGSTGRRPILLGSSIGLTLSLAILGTYFLLERHLIASGMLEAINWMPLTALVVFVALYNGGYGPVAWALVMEMFPHAIKPSGVTICVLTAILFDYAILQLLNSLIVSVGYDWAFWMLAAIGSATFAFAWWMVFETRGLTLVAIQERLAGIKVVRL